MVLSKHRGVALRRHREYARCEDGPMVTVQGVVDRVGPTMLRAVHAAAAPQSVTDVVIAEPGHRNVIAAGDLVLGVAVGGRKDAVDLIRHSKGAAGVLLKQPQAGDDEVLQAAKE